MSPTSPPAGCSAEPASEPGVLHVDMDAFFAAVEVRDDPTLAGRPVIVGGSGQRGVVASCTYEARAFGIHSAMPSVQARRLCPDAVFVHGHYGRYEEVSAQLREILLSATPLVEPIGLDEAFLDVRGARRLLGSPHRIAVDIRRRVRDEIRLDCSVGVARSKLVAKLASRAAKPIADRRGTRSGSGVVVVTGAEERAFLDPLPVEALWGVGPATARRLHQLGLERVGDLARVPVGTLEHRLGRAQGALLAALARGDDRRPVVADRPAKSIGHEETFAIDVRSIEALRRHLVRHSGAVADHLRQSGLAGRTVTIKVRYPDFTTVTRSHTLQAGVDTAPALTAVATALLDSVDIDAGVRLLGLSASGLEPTSVTRQLTLELQHQDQEQGAGTLRAPGLQTSWKEVTAAVDAIRRRFGQTAVGPASAAGAHGIEVTERHQAQWGPAAPSPEG